MAFDKIIPQLNLQSQYQPFTESFIHSLIDLSDANLHSIYMCGSIPNGMATPNRSDADFTLVFKQFPDKIFLRKLEVLKTDFLSSYPFITKIDTPICLVSEVLQNPYGWGFWIQIICLCIHGDDLGLKLPELKPSREFILGLNDDTKVILPELLCYYDRNVSFSSGLKLTKRLLRGLCSLTMDREKIWEDDLFRQSDISMGYFPILELDVKTLLSVFSGEKKICSDFRTSAEKIYQFINANLEKE